MREEREEERNRPGCLGRLIRLLITLLLIASLVTMAWTVVLDGGWTHVLLLGVDTDSGGTSRSDTMILASFGPLGQVRLTSILRDTWVEIPGHGSNKINAAYRYGGPELAMQTVSQAFGVKVDQYIAVSYHGLPMLIDAIGGVTVERITQDELRELNANLAATENILRKTGVDLTPLAEAGENVHLTGAQALSYARIRKLGNDYERTARQRRVLQGVASRLRERPYKAVPLLKTITKVTHTNVHWPRIAMLGLFGVIRGDICELRLPAEGTYESGTYNGTWSIRPDLDKNRARLREFLKP